MKRFQTAALALILAAVLLLSACGTAVPQGTDATGTATAPETAQATVTDGKETAEDPTVPAPGEERKNSKGDYLIGNAAETELLRRYPDGQFVIDGEIDMKGAEWETIPAFSGTISGKWGGIFNHTISNFTVKAASGDKNVGMFAELTGSVASLNVKNVTVTGENLSGAAVGVIAGSMSKKNLDDVDLHDCRIEVSGADLKIGGIAGVMEGRSASGCYASGTILATLSGDSVVGGMFGTSSIPLSSDESRMDLDLTASGSSFYAGGLVGVSSTTGEIKDVDYGGRVKIRSTAASSFAAPLAGSCAGTIKDSFSSARAFDATGTAKANDYAGKMAGSVKGCYVRDVSNLDETLSETEYALRKRVADYMDAEVTIPWTPVVEMTYSDDCSSGHNQTYKEGVTYFGLPYVHTCGSLERMKAYLTEDGHLVESVPKVGWNSLIGNDCADAVFWAWTQVSGNVSYLVTNDMYQGNTGTIPVGPYKITSTTSTRDIVKQNGEKVMFESYAAVKMGDGFCFADPNGHARMAIEAAYVYRNPDGSINPDKSYILMDEQGATVKQNMQYRTTCRYHYKYSFRSLFSGAFIPLTIPEFAQGVTTPLVVGCDTENVTKDNLLDVSVTSNYRINLVRVTFTDAAGNATFDKTFYPSAGSHNTSFSLNRLRANLRDLEKKPGTYTLTVTVGSGAGLEETALQTPITF